MQVVQCIIKEHRERLLRVDGAEGTHKPMSGPVSLVNKVTVTIGVL